MWAQSATYVASDNHYQLPTPVRIAGVQQENHRTKTFVLDASLDAYPGQFAMVWLPRFDEKPFSLVDANPVTLMITAVGPFTRLIHEKQVGDFLWLRGPFGNGFHVQPRQQDIVLVGGGYGVAPLLWLAQQQVRRTSSITTIIGARTAADVLYSERFEKVDNRGSAASLEVIVTTEDGTAGITGRVTDALEPILAQHNTDAIFACGPHGMLAAVRELGSHHTVPCQLSWEAYMRCGIGICGACEFEGKVLCMDGPVLAGH